MLRIILDTNVLISAVISEGKPRQLLKLAIRGKFTLLVSEEIVNEFESVLRRPKFALSRRQIVAARRALLKTARAVEVTSSERIIEQDPDDDIFLNAALDGHADYVVSGDAHLLTMSRYGGIEILSVRSMPERLQE